ncbi:uncharacterized protein LOC133470776 isoform X3 [Phyllopteryx taeniolatus]|uniref:uncharacterized protein LOC133470776 isoform X3 n=1 Tax=Phyllopteryx taeniolatus TaxID=161469 RepID=UPI002AD3B4FC|nr:uncharacterized protein LOC133470776 isoform X3 [Phyllopteryx taeniolatus]
MVDTGARHSTVITLPPERSLTAKGISLVGFRGEETILHMTTPVHTQCFTQTLLHSFVYAPNCPVNLLGRGLLIKTAPTIPCSPGGLILQFPDGHIYCCSGDDTSNIYMQDSERQLPSMTCATADIYWAKMDTDSPGRTEAETFWTQWSPWVRHLRPYDMVSDCMHCTLYYDRTGDEVYSEAFQNVEGNIWELQMGDLFVGKPDPTVPPCHPHVSLMVSPQHTAKDLGPFVLSCTRAIDWQPTSHDTLLFSRSLDAYWIQSASYTPTSTLEHCLLDRHHGRETTDSEFANPMVQSLPLHLRSTEPTDVGFCQVQPVKFKMKPDPIWIPQYPMKEAGRIGITETIEGLLKAGVLCKIRGQVLIK